MENRSHFPQECHVCDVFSFSHRKSFHQWGLCSIQCFHRHWKCYQQTEWEREREREKEIEVKSTKCWWCVSEWLLFFLSPSLSLSLSLSPFLPPTLSPYWGLPSWFSIFPSADRSAQSWSDLMKKTNKTMSREWERAREREERETEKRGEERVKCENADPIRCFGRYMGNIDVPITRILQKKKIWTIVKCVVDNVHVVPVCVRIMFQCAFVPS